MSAEIAASAPQAPCTDAASKNHAFLPASDGVMSAEIAGKAPQAPCIDAVGYGAPGKNRAFCPRATE